MFLDSFLCAVSSPSHPQKCAKIAYLTRATIIGFVIVPENLSFFFFFLWEMPATKALFSEGGWTIRI